MNPTQVIAFHGGYLDGQDLREDCGDPSWINTYTDGFNPEQHYTDLRAMNCPLVLLGYSLGGSVIGHLSQTDLPIVGAVLYEAPLIGTQRVGGHFPVLWIRNSKKQSRRREAEFKDTFNKWAFARVITILRGQGGHIRYTTRFPFIAHNWDQALNPMIHTWIDNIDPFDSL